MRASRDRVSKATRFPSSRHSGVVDHAAMGVVVTPNALERGIGNLGMRRTILRGAFRGGVVVVGLNEKDESIEDGWWVCLRVFPGLVGIWSGCVDHVLFKKTSIVFVLNYKSELCNTFNTNIYTIMASHFTISMNYFLGSPGIGSTNRERVPLNERIIRVKIVVNVEFTRPPHGIWRVLSC